MDNHRQLAEHFYTEISPQMQGKVGDAFKMQRNDVLSHIAATIETDGPQMAASQMSALASFSQTYNGRSNPFIGDALNAMHDMVNADIQPGSMEWRDQIRNMGDNHLLRTCSVDDKGQTSLYENASPNVAEQASHPLGEALAYQKEQLAWAINAGDDEDVERFERTIELIERDIQSLNPNPVPAQSVPDAPQPSPAEQSRQDTENRDLQ